MTTKSSEAIVKVKLITLYFLPFMLSSYPFVPCHCFALGNKHSVATPPVVPVNFRDALKGIFSEDAANFLLDMSEKTNSDTFQLLKEPFPRFYVIGNAPAARKIMLDPASTKIPQVYRTYRYLTGSKTSFTMEGEEFDSFEKGIFKPVFHNRAARHRINENFEAYAESWIRNELDDCVGSNKAFDPTSEMRRVLFQAYLKSAFEYETTDDDFHAWEEHISHALPELLLKRGLSPWRSFYDFVFPATRRALQSAKDMQGFAKKVLNSYTSKSRDERSDAPTLIKYISDPNGPIRDNKVRVGQIVDIIIASYMTSGSLVSSVMVMLAKHPKVASKLQKELSKEKNKNLPSLVPSPYLNNIIKETSRLFPPGAVLTSLRYPMKDTYIKNSMAGGQDAVIPKGSAVLVPSILLCRNQHVFDDPNSFHPERWENATKTMEDSMMLFSLGKRKCPGQGLATPQMTFMLEQLCVSYVFDIEEDFNVEEKFKFNGLMTAFCGIKMRAVKKY